MLCDTSVLCTAAITHFIRVMNGGTRDVTTKEKPDTTLTVKTPEENVSDSNDIPIIALIKKTSPRNSKSTSDATKVKFSNYKTSNKTDQTNLNSTDGLKASVGDNGLFGVWSLGTVIFRKGPEASAADTLEPKTEKIVQWGTFTTPPPPSSSSKKKKPDQISACNCSNVIYLAATSIPIT
ncbi:hypothetical protein TB1_003634 [Malus domestica]